MSIPQGARLIRLDELFVPGSLDAMERNDASRRLMTLVDTGSDHMAGGTGKATRLVNCLGESVCVKSVRLPAYRGYSEAEMRRLFAVRADALHEEYLCLKVVSGLPCFAQTLGYGTYAEGPVLLTEWIRGIPLRLLRNLRGIDIASIGYGVLAALACARHRDGRFVHRDLSPSNIMVRLDRHTLEEQMRRHVFDLCLIDLGSTMRSGSPDQIAALRKKVGNGFAWRAGTPAYAPPEMLSHDEGLNLVWRCLETVDTYALCSVLYELGAQHPPFPRTATDVDGIAYGRDCPPLTPRQWPIDGKDLLEAFLDGIVREPEAKPSIDELAQRLADACLKLDEQVHDELQRRRQQLIDAATARQRDGETLLKR